MKSHRPSSQFETNPRTYSRAAGCTHHGGTAPQATSRSCPATAGNGPQKPAPDLNNAPSTVPTKAEAGKTAVRGGCGLRSGFLRCAVRKGANDFGRNDVFG